MDRTTRKGALLVAAFLLLAPPPAPAAGRVGFCGTEQGNAQNALLEHDEQASRRGHVAALRAGESRDVGEIAVLMDQGELVLLKNLMDLGGVGLEFKPLAPGYSLSRVDRPVIAEPGGTPLPLGDDASASAALPFAFNFYGKTYNRVHINSDGNLTFGVGESLMTGRSLRRLLSGPPRIAAFLADLDPSRTGSVVSFSDPNHFSVTWTAVPQFGQMDKNTFQIVLYPDGRITFAYDKELSSLVDEGAVGVAPGNNENGLVGTDLSAAAGVTSGGAIAEAFRAKDALDPEAVAHKFYLSHPDSYQQLVVFTSRPLGRATGFFAQALMIRNADTGLGAEIVDLGARFGSAQRLESVVMMDFVMKYPDDPNAIVQGTASTLSILAQEVAHRWGAYALFREGAGTSDELLGPDNTNWSFFMDTDGSHLQGNDIQDLGGGVFKTVGASQRYSALDQYLMGVRPAAEVPPFFIVRNVTGTNPNRAQTPEVGSRFQGVRKDVTIDDIIAAVGPRNPAPGQRAPYRQAFVYVDAGNMDSGAPVAHMDRIRTTWEPFFAESTQGRWAVDTRLLR
jgi:hypothetical protein